MAIINRRSLIRGAGLVAAATKLLLGQATLGGAGSVGGAAVVDTNAGYSPLQFQIVGNQTNTNPFTAMSAVKSGPVLMFNWGDGSAPSYSNSASHSYTLSSTYTLTVTPVDGWSGVTQFVVESPQGSGHSPYTGTAQFSGNNPQFPATLSSLAVMVNCTKIQSCDTWWCNAFPALPWASLQYIDFQGNNFSSYDPSAGFLLAPSLYYADLHFSGLTAIPNTSNNTLLQHLDVHEDALTGTITTTQFQNNPLLIILYLGQDVDTTLTGSWPLFGTYNTALQQLTLDHNPNVNPACPNVAACTALTLFTAIACNLTSVTPGSFSTQANLATLSLYFNALPAAQINQVLADCVASLSLSGRVACTLTLNGSTNAAPTGTGITNKATLIAAGWTVTTT